MKTPALKALVITAALLGCLPELCQATASNVIFPTNYPYTQSNLLEMHVIYSSNVVTYSNSIPVTNGVLEATVSMYTAGTNTNPINYGDGVLYSGIGSSNVTSSSTNAGMYAWAYQWSVNGTNYPKEFPGTVLHLNAGDTLKVHEYNYLANGYTNSTNAAFVSNFHYHGSHAPDLSQGDNIYFPQQSGTKHDVVIPISNYENSVGLNWYHPHVHEQSKIQVQGGLAGFIDVGDPLAPWPQYVGKYKQVYMGFSEINIQTNSNGRPQTFELETGDKYGPGYTAGWQKRINGQINPIITIAPGETQIWKWGMIASRGGIAPVIADANLSNAWTNCTMLSRDGNSAFVNPYTGALSSNSLRMQDIANQSILCTGGRTTWAVTAPTNPGTYYIMDGWGGEESPNNASGTNYFYVLATINVTGTRVTNSPPIFTNQPVDPLWSAIPNNYRTFGLEQNYFSTYDSNNTSIDKFYVNGYQFGKGPMSQLEIGQVEEWTIVNGGPLNHPFHIHQGNFIVTQVGGVKIDPSQPPNPLFASRNYISPQDVVWVPAYQSVTVRFRVQNFPGKYVWHCHILEHEDEGMMSPIFQYPNRAGIRLGLGGSMPYPPVIDGNGNLLVYLSPPSASAGPMVIASGVGTDTSGLELPNPVPTNATQANAAYAGLTVKQTMAVGCQSGSSVVKVYTNGVTTAPTASFQAFPNNSGVSLAVGAISTNGAVRIIAGSRAKGPADVRIFDVNGNLLNEYKGFMPGTFPNGVNVAVGDVNHDNFDDLVVSAGAGREALITALDGNDISTNSTNPNALFTVVAGDPSSKDGVKVAVGYIAPATVPSYFPNLITTPELGRNSGTVEVWNLADLVGVNSMSGMSTNSTNSEVMPLADFRPFGASVAPVNIATTYQAIPNGQTIPAIAAWQLRRQATFTTMDLTNNTTTQLRRW